jgi:hypothetical protein
MSLGKLRAAVLAIVLAIATTVAADTSFMQSTRYIDRCKERARALACTGDWGMEKLRSSLAAPLESDARASEDVQQNVQHDVQQENEPANLSN